MLLCKYECVFFFTAFRWRYYLSGHDQFIFHFSFRMNSFKGITLAFEICDPSRLISWSVHLRYVCNTAAGVVEACIGRPEPAAHVSTQCSQQAWAACPPASATLTLLCCCRSKAGTSVAAHAAVRLTLRYCFRICLMICTYCVCYSLFLFGNFISEKDLQGKWK